MKNVGKTGSPIKHWEIQLIKEGHIKNDRFKFVETVAMRAIAKTKSEAIDKAYLFGAIPNSHRNPVTRPHYVERSWPCIDKRFLRVQIVKVLYDTKADA